MKNTFLLFFFLLCTFSGFAQQTIDATLMHDGIEREFIIYLPANYTGNEPVPMIFNFHGFTSNAGQQLFYSDFRTIADTAGFILVHPEGTLFNGNTHFNVGGFTAGSTVDDVGFTSAMIDYMSAEYNINLDRVYSTGMSNGGFMSFLLACQLSDRIAAVASVTGSMTPETFNPCNPQHPTPVLQIHGTVDATVPYNGANWTKPINDVIEYWVDFNNITTTPTTTVLPDINILDLSTAEQIVYQGGDNGATVEHFKIIGGGHTWPGAALVLPGTNMDFSASEEIWRFFSQFDINGELGITSVEDLVENQINVYPNPTHSTINITSDFSRALEYEVISPIGETLLTGSLRSSNEEIDLSGLGANIYYLKVGTEVFKILKN